MKKQFTFLIFISIFTCSFSQNTETRELNNFSFISASSVVNLVLTQGNEYSVTVEAPKHLLQNVITKMNENELDIFVTGTWKSNEKALVHVTLPTLEKLKTSGAANVSSTDMFTSDKLVVFASGASKIKLSLSTTDLTINASGAAALTLVGYVQNATFLCSGSSKIDAQELNVDKANANISGAAKAHLNVKESLNGIVSGAGKIEITGNPLINKLVNNSVNRINSEYTYFEDVEVKNDVVGDIIYKETMDSTYLSIGKKRVIIVEDMDKTRVDVQLKDTTKEKSISLETSFDVGMNGYLTSTQSISLPATQNLMELNYSRSREFSWNMMIGGLDFAKDRLYFTTGLGLNYVGYHFKNNINISTSNDTTAFSAVTEPSYNKYKLRGTYLQMPMLFGVRIGNVKKDYGLQFGVIGGMKIGSIVKEKYNFEGKNVKNKIKDDYNLNPFKVTATVRLRFNYFSVYANYALTPLFEKNKAPGLYPFSVGLNVGI